ERTAADAEPAERHAPPSIPLLPMQPLTVQETSNTLFFQYAAAGLGILIASIFNLHLLQIFAHPDPVPNPGLLIRLFPLLDTLFTGIGIGGGSQPIHVLIRFITERKIAADASAEGAADAEGEVEKTRELAKVISTNTLLSDVKEEQAFTWMNIAYA